MTGRPLRILQVNTTDARGGAQRVAWQLFTGYRARGHRSWLAVGQKLSQDPDVLVIPNRESRATWYYLCQALSSRLRQAEQTHHFGSTFSGLAASLCDPPKWIDYHLGREDFHFPGTSQLLGMTGATIDVVHTHNLHGNYFDLRVLPGLSQHVPVVMTLHDAWLLSGHCAHSFSCERWRRGCGRCPDLTIYPSIQRDATGYNWQRKRTIYARSRLHVATPSRWLMEKVHASMLAPAVVEARVLPNGVDLHTFRPGDKRLARERLGIDPGARVLLATGIVLRQNRWKDYTTLRQAVIQVAAQLQDQPLLLVVLGEQAPREWVHNAEIRFVPFEEDPETVARHYQAADIYVHAALADTFPTSILEALACGTPVVATRVGGIQEQIEEAETGFLVPVGDAGALARRVMQLLSNEAQRDAMGRLAVERARRRYDLDRQIAAYLDWYADLAAINSSTTRHV